MADSVRHQIMDAVVAELKAIRRTAGYESDVKLVSEKWQGYQTVALSDLPAIFPIDGNEKKKPSAVGIGASDDTEATLTVTCTCIIYDRLGNLRQKRTDLIRDVEKALVNGSTLDGLISYIEPTEIITDGGTVENYSIWDQSFEITYTYASTAGG